MTKTIVYLSDASLIDVIIAAKRMCIEQGIAFDAWRIGVTTYSESRIAVYIMSEDEASLKFDPDEYHEMIEAMK